MVRLERCFANDFGLVLHKTNLFHWYEILQSNKDSLSTCLMLVISADCVRSVFYHYSLKKLQKCISEHKLLTPKFYWVDFTSRNKTLILHIFNYILLPSKAYSQISWSLLRAGVLVWGGHWKLDKQAPTRQQELDGNSSLFRLLQCSSDLAKNLFQLVHKW